MAAICPDGSLTYGAGRFVLTGTAELHSRIQQLSMRVQKLEAALEAAHGLTSTETHPLLRDEEKLEHAIATDVPLTENEKIWRKEDDVTSNFSMLAIEDDVKRSRFTPSHFSLWYLHNMQDPHHAPSLSEKPGASIPSAFPIDLLCMAIAPLEQSDVLHQKLLACLPPFHVALSLVDVYYRNTGSMHNIVPQHLFNEEFWPAAYEGAHSNSVALAVVYGMLALGAKVHPSLPAGSLSAQKYYNLAILAMSQDPLSIVHIEALYLFTVYNCGVDITSSKTWALLGLTIKLAQTLGIDRECPQWRISEKDRQRRRRVFHELHSLDCYVAMTVGRINFIPEGQHNSPLPQSLPGDSPGQVEFEKMFNWKYLFAGQGIRSMLNLVLSTTKPSSYQAILAVDKKLRSYDSLLDAKYVKQLGTWPTPESGTSRQIRLQQQFTLLLRESTFVHLHRGFLNRAVLEPTGDPILSKYSISVMAAYQSSCALIRQVRLMRDNEPELLRVLSCPNAVLTAVIALGALVIRTPFSSLASVAIQELRSGCELMRGFFDPNFYLMPVLAKLESCANKAYADRDSHPLKASTSALPDVQRPLDTPVEDKSQTTPPADLQETLGIFLNSESELSGLNGVLRPPQPDTGGSNWYFTPHHPEASNGYSLPPGIGLSSNGLDLPFDTIQGFT